jgi:antitoxin component YwqK of YwqJK toxin-antitoxin module
MGEFDGKSIRWYENGNLESETDYKNGEQHGYDILYYENEKKAHEMLYLKGFFISEKCWDPKGIEYKCTDF